MKVASTENGIIFGNIGKHLFLLLFAIFLASLRHDLRRRREKGAAGNLPQGLRSLIIEDL